MYCDGPYAGVGLYGPGPGTGGAGFKCVDFARMTSSAAIFASSSAYSGDLLVIDLNIICGAKYRQSGCCLHLRYGQTLAEEFCL